LITCIIVIGIGLIVVYSRRKPKLQRTEVAMTPMPATAFENPANDAEARTNNNLYAGLQQPTAAEAGAVGGVGTGDNEPSAMYESLLDDQQKSSQVLPSFETFKGN